MREGGLSAVLILALGSVACGSSDDTSGESAGSGAGTNGDGANGGAGTADCESYTEFDGDCIRPPVPDPSEGFQIHYGPRDYDDPDDLDRFVLEPGGEVNDCFYTQTPNEEEIFYDGYQARMRPGTHHLIVFATENDVPHGELRECSGGRALGGGGGGGGLGSGQTRWLFAAQSGLGPDGGRLDYPPAGESVPPENEGLAFRLGPKQNISYNMHYVNSGDEPLLRESWASFYYVDESDVEQLAEPIVFIGGLGMNIPPNTTEVVTASCEPPSGQDEVRVVDLWPHMHAHGERFTAYKVSESGERTRLYESYDWEEPLSVFFDSVHDNPEPDAEARTDGAVSGLVTLEPGDRIEYECEIRNDLDQSLVFANEAYTAEMCNLFGTYTPAPDGSWFCFNQ